MQKIFLSVLLCFSMCCVVAQSKLPAVDKSPMDMSYYPSGYPVQKMQGKVTEPLVARVIYSRPQKNGRVVFGELLEYGKVWRLGANEATEIEFFQNVKFGNSKIKKGRYTMYCVPYTDKWTIIINKDLDAWGSFTYDSKKDVARLEVPIEKTAESLDSFTMAFDKTATGFGLIIAWDNIRATVPFTLQ
jgi:hypothetical protein